MSRFLPGVRYGIRAELSPDIEWADNPGDLSAKAADMSSRVLIEGNLVIKSVDAEVWMNIKPKESLADVLEHHLAEHDRGDMPAFDTEAEERLFLAAARALVG